MLLLLAAHASSMQHPALKARNTDTPIHRTTEPLLLAQARIVWETPGQEPVFGSSFSFTPKRGPNRVEADALWPDGRRAFAATNLVVRTDALARRR